MLILTFIKRNISCYYYKLDICDTLFKGYLHENEALQIPIFYMTMNQFNIVFHIWHLPCKNHGKTTFMQKTDTIVSA